MVRIAWRDLAGWASLGETLADTSAFADAAIEAAVEYAEHDLARMYGEPRDVPGVLQPFIVLGMGKLGGEELNFSSDVDLLYLYDGGVEPAVAEISNREYFVRLAQQTTELLSRHTREGPVFRIDLRLRPQGGEVTFAFEPEGFHARVEFPAVRQTSR